ncbi:conserved exported protein of unknown function [Tenacibaculum sp. 190524A02b]|uniref:Peptidase M12B domain-containing protein n=1 Tax=Tenacibaculum vairaonense TaxID=3137860 RepID=A0ABM9PGR4_9FLAO
MKRARNLFVILLILCSIQIFPQGEIQQLLEEEKLKLNEVEDYVSKNFISLPRCIESKNYIDNGKGLGLNQSHIPIDNGEIYVFNIYFHILNENGGSRSFPISEDDIQEAVAILNKTFNPFKIFFKYQGHGNIDSTWRSVVYLRGRRTFGQLVDYAKSLNVYKENSLNIFIASTIRYSQYDDSPLVGIADKPGTNSVIEDEYLLTSSLPHEVAHNFLLHHTHYRSTSENCDLVVQNDLVDDTRPSLIYKAAEIGSDCITYTGNKSKTKCGIDYSYLPTNNFMSANILPCRSLKNAMFTKGQGDRMRKIIKERMQTDYNRVLGTVESLYEPYNKRKNQTFMSIKGNTLKYQKGFDYQFVDCNDYNTIFESYSSKELVQNHPYYTAVKILQLSKEKAYNCNFPENKKYVSGVVLSFGATISNHYKLKDLSEVELYNPTMIMKNLPKGFNLVKTVCIEGKEEKKLVYKLDN